MNYKEEEQELFVRVTGIAVKEIELIIRPKARKAI